MQRQHGTFDPIISVAADGAQRIVLAEGQGNNAVVTALPVLDFVSESRQAHKMNGICVDIVVFKFVAWHVPDFLAILTKAGFVPAADVDAARQYRRFYVYCHKALC